MPAIPPTPSCVFSAMFEHSFWAYNSRKRHNTTDRNYVRHLHYVVHTSERSVIEKHVFAVILLICVSAADSLWAVNQLCLKMYRQHGGRRHNCAKRYRLHGSNDSKMTFNTKVTVENGKKKCSSKSMRLKQNNGHGKRYTAKLIRFLSQFRLFHKYLLLPVLLHAPLRCTVAWRDQIHVLIFFKLFFCYSKSRTVDVQNER